MLGNLQSHSHLKILLFGDSHAGNYFPFWDVMANYYNFKLTNNYIDSRYPFLSEKNFNNKPAIQVIKDSFRFKECLDRIQNLSTHINDYDIYILAGFWYSLNNTSFDALKITLDILQKYNKKVIVMGSTPTGVVHNNTYIRNMFLLNSLKIKSFISNTHHYFIFQNDPNNPKIFKLTQRYNNVYYFNVDNIYGSQLLAKMYLGNKSNNKYFLQLFK